MADQRYYFAWKSPFDGQGSRTRWPELYKREFRILKHGAMNSRLVKFTDTGRLEIINGQSIRKVKPGSSPQAAIPGL